MKKTLVLAFFVLFAWNAQAQDKAAIEWHSFDEVMALSEKEPKMIFVKVYTDWCGWCKKMDKETFTDSKVIQYINDNFYAVKMNAEDSDKKYSFRGKDYTDETMARTMRVSSYPNFVIMDAGMENITQLPGYREPQAFLSSLSSLLDNFKP